METSNSIDETAVSPDFLNTFQAISSNEGDQTTDPVDTDYHLVEVNNLNLTNYRSIDLCLQNTSVGISDVDHNNGSSNSTVEIDTGLVFDDENVANDLISERDFEPTCERTLNSPVEIDTSEIFIDVSEMSMLPSDSNDNTWNLDEAVDIRNCSFESLYEHRTDRVVDNFSDNHEENGSITQISYLCYGNQKNV